jgi:threonine dehydrogenase-like Zn-dependent dehydrogenase
MHIRFGSRFVLGDELLGTSDDGTSVVITHRYPIEEAAEAFGIAGDKAAGAIRVVIEPT